MADEIPGSKSDAPIDISGTATPEPAADVASDGAQDSAAPAGAAQSLKDGAAKLTQQAGEKARAYAEDGKARAGGALDELSKMLHDAAGTVDDKIGAQYGQYARTAADQVSSFSESLKTKQLDDLLGEAQAFVKKSPAVAIGTAAAIGFVLVRLVKSGLDANASPDA